MPNYTKVNWVNDKTLLNAENLNHMDEGIHSNSEEINKNSTDIKTISDDLSNLKTNAPTVTITQGNTQKGSFNLINQTEDVTIAIDAPPSASKTLPKPDGEASYGVGKSWSRADHVHPQNAFTEINVGDTSITSSFNASNLNLVGSDGISLSTSERNITFKANKVTLTLTEVNNTISSYKIIKGHLEYNVTINGTLYPIVVNGDSNGTNDVTYNTPLNLDVGTYVVSERLDSISSSDYYQIGNYYCELDLTNPGIYNLSYTDIISNTFSENDWKTIAKAARTGEAHKRWKVGDYKFIDYPEVTRPGYISDSTSGKNLFFQTRNGTRPSPYSLGTITLKYPHKLVSLIENAVITEGSKDTGTYRIYTYLWKEDIVKPCLCYFASGATYPTNILHESSTFEQLLEDIGAVITKTADGETYLTNENLENFGVHISEGFSYKTGKVYPATQYPIMILGFNHDNISNPYEYGKTKAGMTLCLGITRAATDNSPPYHWDMAILPDLYESGVSQFDSAKSNDTLMSPYWLGDGETNWEICQFREELQHLLDNTELTDKLVSVEKITAAGMWQENNNYFPKVFTNDKISLLSEYEIIGGLKFSNAQEGDQYEYFKRGFSRFFWDSRLVNKETDRLYLWLRSPINPTSFSSGVSKPLEYQGGCNLQCNSIDKAITSNTSIATITNNTTAINKIWYLVGELDEYRYNSVPVTYSITNGTYSIEMQGTIASPSGQSISESFSTVEEVVSFFANYGITLVNPNQNASFEIRISRDEQVGYAQGANGRSANGTLLPIFCL